MNRRGLVTSAAALALSLLLALSGEGRAGAQSSARPGGPRAGAPSDVRPTDAGMVFRGWVGKYPVRMTLRRGAGGELSGSYSYEGRAGELALKGTVDAGGKVVLEEFDGAKQTGVFSGSWEEKEYLPGVRIEGDWKRPGGGGAQGFSLSEESGAGPRVTSKRLREQDARRRYEVEAVYPQVAAAVGFNRLVENLVRKEVREFKGRPSEVPPRDAPANSLRVDHSVRLATDELVSAEFTVSHLEHGMAHPAYELRAVNYDLKAGRQLALADLFRPGSDYLKRISSAAVERLRRLGLETGGDANVFLSDPDYLEGASPKLKNYRVWTLTPRGLAVTFEPYQVGPFAAGAPSVLIPYSELREVIRPDGPLAPLLK